MRKKQNRPGKKIANLLQKRMRPHDIKNRLKVSGASVRYWAKKLGLHPFKKGRPVLKNGEHGKNFKTDVRKLVKEMHREGRTFREIGKTLGVSWQRAHQYFGTAN